MPSPHDTSEPFRQLRFKIGTRYSTTGVFVDHDRRRGSISVVRWILFQNVDLMGSGFDSWKTKTSGPEYNLCPNVLMEPLVDRAYAWPHSNSIMGSSRSSQRVLGKELSGNDTRVRKK